MNIAIIGSGIAGLAAAWHLGRQHRVTLIEKHREIGMAAHGIEWGGARVDVPLRVVYPGYYPNLLALYKEAGIRVTPADYSAAFCDREGQTYFRYTNWRAVKGLSVPLLRGGQPFGRRSRHIVLDLLRFYLRAGRDARLLDNQPLTLMPYLRGRGFSDAFIEDFLLPTFAAICTCDTDAVREYPAQRVVDYLRRGVLLEGVSRTALGADDVVRRLASRCAEVRLGVAVTSVERHGQGVRVREADGSASDFDHVVLATQGNQARRLLVDASDTERGVLGRFTYQPSDVIVHTDTRLMPGARRDWSPVNFLVDRAVRRPMATIWLNRVLPMAADAADAFQTWNPLIEPDPDTILARAQFERPVVNADSEAALVELVRLHGQADRRVWFCGSYAQSGVPLLESAAASARQVTETLSRLPDVC